GNDIPLDIVVEQNIMLNLPLRVVCDEACKGFCPKCGTELNQRKCDCTIDNSDPRLAVLKELFKPGNSPKEVEK
ncbi:MAG: DUF177 domain-containing protein, partial [Bacillota bacterium]|nr:DUF177 domain-containing protein [Bacillota bacterium]